jgi:integrase
MYDKLRPLEFHGAFKEHLKAFVLEKRGLGLKYGNSFVFNLQHFDRFSMDYDCAAGLSKELALAWTKRLSYHVRSTQESRISLMRQFAIYLRRNNVPACVLPICNSTEFYRTKPHVFTEHEISRIFAAADTFMYRKETPNRHLIMPLVFRVLYCCGLRISEALKLRNCDVDLERGMFEIVDAKGERDRIIPINEQLRVRCVDYYEKVHTNPMPTNYFFPSPYGGYYDQSTVYRAFRQALAKCGISHGGRKKGPRVHDLRHTFSVHSFRRFIADGRDPMEILPILAAYLGHKTYAGTTHYLHLVSEVFPEITDAVEKIYGSFIPVPVVTGGEAHETN